jgi:choline dehydrogenase-like flavoprotein
MCEFGLMLGALPPAARKALATALITLDQGARLYPPARGRRFAGLDDRVAGAYLRALLARRDAVADVVQRLRGVVTMCYYQLPEVQREIGYDPAPYIAAVSRRRLESYGPQIRAGGGEPAAARPGGLLGQADVAGDLSLACGAVVVGSGAGGATVAAELAAAGVDVIVLEEGGYHPTESFTADTGRALRTLYRDGGGGMAIGRPSVLYTEGRCVGGSTVVNGGMSWRTPGRVLDRWAEQEGLRAISEQELDPYFTEIESRLSVRTQDPETIGRDSALFKAGAEASGWNVVPNRRNQLHCAGTNSCSTGCPTGAKRSMLLTSVPRALALGARVFADCRVDSIILSGPGVAGVTGHFVRPGGRRGPKLAVRARVVIVAGGAVQTPALVMRSGLRSASGMLGRNLSLHPNAVVTAFFDTDVTGWQGVHQAFQVREFLAEGLLLTATNLTPPMLAGILPAHGRELGALMADYNRIVTAGPLIEDTGTGRIRNVPGLGPQVFYQLTDYDADRAVRGVEWTAEALFAAGARRMLLPFDGAPEVRSMDELRRLLARPVPKRSVQLFSIHLMGTARMSEDPRRGVVGSFGEFHGVPGLFVTDASGFPGPIGINPMETVIALAMRDARRLIEQRDRWGI